MRPFACLSIGVVLALLAPAISRSAELSQADRARLLAAYPGLLERIDGNDLVWRDGTRMLIDDGKGDKPFEQWLADPDVADMFAVPYPAGAEATPPAKDIDPGRARTAAFFNKVYGDCRKGRRPSFDDAAPAGQARELYEHFAEASRRLGVRVETGVFQADMAVTLVNDGPVTLIVETPVTNTPSGSAG